MRLAICYWGMTRSTRFVYETHYKYLFNVLKENEIEYDVFMHTWKTTDDVNVLWETISDIKVDYEEYKLLKPNYYCIENQDEFLKTIYFPDYFNLEQYKMYGEAVEWRPQLIVNHLCALESQKRVYNMVVEQSNSSYDFIMFIRPDVELGNMFNVKWLDSAYDIAVPNYDHYSGLNDKFAILPFSKASNYAQRINEIKEFRKNNGRIVSEKYVKYIVDKYYGPILFIDFKMIIIRPNGKSG